MKDLQKKFEKEMQEYKNIRLESIKAQQQHDDFAITAHDVPAKLTDNLNRATEKETEFKRQYASKVFELLSKTKPELIRRRDSAVINWEDAFGNDFSKLPPELWGSLVALVEEKGGQYRLKN